MDRFRFAVGRFVCIAVLVGTASTWAADVYHDNVVIVLDASGSMHEAMRATGTEKMAAAKQALKEVLSQVPSTTHVGLLVFSARGESDPWVYPLGVRDDAVLMKAIDRPRPGGGTPLGQYMQIGANRLLEERKKQFAYGTYRLLIVTDGQAQDGHVVESVTPQILARGITVDVIGVDMGNTHTLATKAHSYRSADNPESLKKAIAEVFAEVSTTGTDATQADAFDVIASIPIETAAGMITALTLSGNEPIGGAVTAPATGQQQTSRQQGAPPQPSGGSTTGRAASKPRSGISWPTKIFGALVVLALIKTAFTRRRG